MGTRLRGSSWVRASSSLNSAVAAVVFLELRRRPAPCGGRRGRTPRAPPRPRPRRAAYGRARHRAAPIPPRAAGGATVCASSLHCVAACSTSVARRVPTSRRHDRLSSRARVSGGIGHRDHTVDHQRDHTDGGRPRSSARTRRTRSYRERRERQLEALALGAWRERRHSDAALQPVALRGPGERWSAARSRWTAALAPFVRSLRIEVPEVTSPTSTRLAPYPLARPDRRRLDPGRAADYARDLCEYWRTRYSWRRCEAELTAAAVLHLARRWWRRRGRRPLPPRPLPHADALPLVLTHGWPGSFVEFLEVIGPLTDPPRTAGRRGRLPRRVPSLPGFGFSGKPRQAGWGSAHRRRVVAS